MDLEELSKTQIVLLTLLVSFVTSIATGIVTVSLMGVAPPIVAQTVNRVIEQTVQQVAAPASQSAGAASTQVKTVVVKESDLISQAIASADPSIVRLYSSSGSDSPAFYGLGVITNASGTIATDAGGLGENADAIAVLQGGNRVRAFVSSRDSTTGVVYLVTATSTTVGKPVSWTPIALAADHATLGETVISIAGKTADRVAQGIITALDQDGTIETDVSADSILPGTPAFATDGSILGLSTVASRAVSASAFVPASALTHPPAASAK